ncbi:unnamed protein product, partial [Haemonchus placei]|uniref:Uncharacterized protein n=1 Tax=Haemonchus placei TaxID=6290 RepID=A0A0N4WPT0_HAEPC
PFLPIERFRKTKEGESFQACSFSRNFTAEVANEYPKKFAAFANVRGKKNWNAKEDSHSQPCTLKKT